jgi:hypothetical protein
VAQETLEAARAYKELTEAAADQIEGSQAGSLTFRLEMHRERAAARISSRKIPGRRSGRPSRGG